MARPRDLDPTESLPAFFGAQLRRYREMAGLAQADVADALKWSVSTVNAIEAARRPLPRGFAPKVDALLDARGALVEIAKAIDAAPHWFDRYLDREAEATAIRIWEMRVIPGLYE